MSAPPVVIRLLPPDDIEYEPPYKWVLTAPDGDSAVSIADDLTFVPILDGEWGIEMHVMDETYDNPYMSGVINYPEDIQDDISGLAWADDDDWFEPKKEELLN